MLSKNQLKFIRSLHQGKFRHEHGLFLAEGPKVVEEIIRSRFRVHSLYATENWTMKGGTSHQPLEVTTISPKELERISTLQAPNEVVAVVHMAAEEKALPDATSGLVLVLDGIRDPGNLGTIIRTADWFGFRDIVCSPDCVDVYNPKVVQATMGSIARVVVHYRELAEIFGSRRKEVPVYGALLDGQNIYAASLLQHGYLLIGSESHGISPPAQLHITDPLRIPSFGDEAGTGAESLNASIATAILCAEFRRRSK